MPDITPILDFIASAIPLDCMQMRFMQLAMLGLILLAPMCAAMGVQVVNFRMAFFSDAISHSALTGAAVGLMLGVDTRFTMIAFGILIGMGIMAIGRRGRLSFDTVIGVFFSAAVAFGLAMISRDRHAARNVQQFLYGDVLTIGQPEVIILACMFVLLMTFQIFAYNRLLFIGLNPSLASAYKVHSRAYQYIFAIMLSVIVVFCVWAVGVLLVTAMLIVPAAAARNLARSAGGMFWWAIVISVTSAIAGLLLSFHPAIATATGATVVLCASVWFVFSLLVALLRRTFLR